MTAPAAETTVQAAETTVSTAETTAPVTECFNECFGNFPLLYYKQKTEPTSSHFYIQVDHYKNNHDWAYNFMLLYTWLFNCFRKFAMTFNNTEGLTTLIDGSLNNLVTLQRVLW